MSDCVNEFNTCTFKKIGDELQGRSLGKIRSVCVGGGGEGGGGAEKGDLGYWYLQTCMYL